MGRAETTHLDRVLSYLLGPSQLTHHGTACCAGARSWIRAFDRSAAFINGHWAPPTWIRERYTWGPRRWPIAWCQVIDSEVLDCGALAALATEVFRMRGDSATQIQMVLQYSAAITHGWQSAWQGAGESADWISGSLCYHEATVIVRGKHASIWDPTDSQWIEDDLAGSGSFGAVVALKPSHDVASPNGVIHWGMTELSVGRWTIVNAVDAEEMSVDVGR